MKRTTNDLIALQIRIGAVLREMRTQTKTSQNDIAKRLKMQSPYYGAIERGERNLTLKTILRLCKVYEISIHTLLIESRSENADE